MERVYLPEVFRRWARWNSGSRGRVNAYWRTLAQGDPHLSRAAVTVEVVMGDVVVRAARRVLKTTSTLDSRVYTYLPMLMAEPEVESLVTLGQQSAGARMVSVELAASALDPSALIARGRALSGVAEVSLQVDNGDYDLRLVLMRGVVVGEIDFGAARASSGGAEEVVRLQIADPRSVDSLYVPSVTIDTDRWSEAQDAAIGERYPLVLGSGYKHVPAPRIKDSPPYYFLAASPVEHLTAASVWKNGSLLTPVSDWAEVVTQDGRGTRVLAVEPKGAAAVLSDNDSFHVEVASSRPRSVSQIAEHLLAGYTSLGRAGLDLAAFGEAHSRMPTESPHVLVNASGKAVSDVVKYVESGLLKSFPMVHMAYHGAGLGPVVVDRRLGPGAGGLHLVGGRGPLLDRVGGPTQVSVEALFTEFEVRYKQNLMERTYESVVRRDPSTSVGCQLAREACGGDRPGPVLESPYIRTDTLASYVVDWLAAHYSTPTFYVEWSCSARLHTLVRLGQPVLYTDAEFPVFTEAQAYVERLVWRRGDHRVGLRVWHPVWNRGLGS